MSTIKAAKKLKPLYPNWKQKYEEAALDCTDSSEETSKSVEDCNGTSDTSTDSFYKKSMEVLVQPRKSGFIKAFGAKKLLPEPTTEAMDLVSSTNKRKCYSAVENDDVQGRDVQTRSKTLVALATNSTPFHSRQNKKSLVWDVSAITNKDNTSINRDEVQNEDVMQPPVKKVTVLQNVTISRPSEMRGNQSARSNVMKEENKEQSIFNKIPAEQNVNNEDAIDGSSRDLADNTLKHQIRDIHNFVCKKLPQLTYAQKRRRTRIKKRRTAATNKIVDPLEKHLNGEKAPCANSFAESANDVTKKPINQTVLKEKADVNNEQLEDFETLGVLLTEGETCINKLDNSPILRKNMNKSTTFSNKENFYMDKVLNKTLQDVAAQKNMNSSHLPEKADERPHNDQVNSLLVSHMMQKELEEIQEAPLNSRSNKTVNSILCKTFKVVISPTEQRQVLDAIRKSISPLQKPAQFVEEIPEAKSVKETVQHIEKQEPIESPLGSTPVLSPPVEFANTSKTSIPPESTTRRTRHSFKKRVLLQPLIERILQCKDDVGKRNSRKMSVNKTRDESIEEFPIVTTPVLTATSKLTSKHTSPIPIILQKINEVSASVANESNKPRLPLPKPRIKLSKKVDNTVEGNVEESFKEIFVPVADILLVNPYATGLHADKVDENLIKQCTQKSDKRNEADFTNKVPQLMYSDLERAPPADLVIPLDPMETSPENVSDVEIEGNVVLIDEATGLAVSRRGYKSRSRLESMEISFKERKPPVPKPRTNIPKIANHPVKERAKESVKMALHDDSSTFAVDSLVPPHSDVEDEYESKSKLAKVGDRPLHFKDQVLQPMRTDSEGPAVETESVVSTIKKSKRGRKRKEPVQIQSSTAGTSNQTVNDHKPRARRGRPPASLKTCTIETTPQTVDFQDQVLQPMRTDLEDHAVEPVASTSTKPKRGRKKAKPEPVASTSTNPKRGRKKAEPVHVQNPTAGTSKQAAIEPKPRSRRGRPPTSSATRTTKTTPPKSAKKLKAKKKKSRDITEKDIMMYLKSKHSGPTNRKNEEDRMHESTLDVGLQEESYNPKRTKTKRKVATSVPEPEQAQVYHEENEELIEERAVNLEVEITQGPTPQMEEIDSEAVAHSSPVNTPCERLRSTEELRVSYEKCRRGARRNCNGLNVKNTPTKQELCPDCGSTQIVSCILPLEKFPPRVINATWGFINFGVCWDNVKTSQLVIAPHTRMERNSSTVAMTGLVLKGEGLMEYNCSVLSIKETYCFIVYSGLEYGFINNSDEPLIIFLSIFTSNAISI